MANLFLTSMPELKRLGLPPDSQLAEGIKAVTRMIEAEKSLNRFRQTWFEILLSRDVDNFQCYLADVFHILFRARPEILKSGQKISVVDVLNCSSLDEVVTMVAARKVDELAYGGFQVIRKYLVDRIGIPDIKDTEQLRLVTEAIAVRNIIVHNRGHINARFLEETARTDLVVGNVFTFDLNELDKYFHAIQAVSYHIDRELVTKFGYEVFGMSDSAE